MKGATLRNARSTDAGKVGAILSAFIDDTEWLPRLHSRAEDVSFAGMMIDRGWVSIAEAGGQVLGFCAREGEFVHALYIHASACGHGLGAMLLAEMKATSDRLELFTFEANTRARAFYSKHQFVEVERGNGLGNDEGLPDIRMEWRR